MFIVLYIILYMSILSNAVNFVGAPVKAVGNAALDLLSSHVTYAPPPTPAVTPATTPQKPPMISAKDVGAIDVPQHFKTGIQKAYSLYPEVPKGLLETVLMQESSMGTNTANAKRSAGNYGYLAGITKTGRYADMLKMPDNFQVFQAVPGSKDLTTADGALGVSASILAQIIRNNYNGQAPKNPDGLLDMYDKYYKTLAGHSLTDAQKTRFKTWYTYYQSQH
jgi:hypothetical protein